ncbi:hypothetical protein JOC95_002553 [Bacillus tianshenii]|uniref:Spore germination protein GerPE n=2 Tax=Sutcliffiella tianshenii TaxID=1463404 RepID=A0ABS2P261_9BACI|nr:hypothetical protein [Bacillus tianshenii]
MENPIPIVNENVQMCVNNVNPNIFVNRIKIKGISSSSVLQVGSTNTIFAEAKIKHIRQLLGDAAPLAAKKSTDKDNDGKKE